MNAATLFESLQHFCENGSEHTQQKGYQWFQHTHIPILKKGSEILTNNRDLVAEAWLITGEVYELINAPLQATTCYQIGLHFNPASSDLYRWLALVLEQLGDYLVAMNNIELALKYSNEGIALMEDRQRIQDCMVYDKTPNFVESDLEWKYCEELANNEWEEVIQKIIKSETNNLDYLKCLYRAYGATKEVAKGEAVWQQILTIDPTNKLDEIDLFYWT